MGSANIIRNISSYLQLASECEMSNKNTFLSQTPV